MMSPRLLARSPFQIAAVGASKDSAPTGNSFMAQITLRVGSNMLSAKLLFAALHLLNGRIDLIFELRMQLLEGLQSLDRS